MRRRCPKCGGTIWRLGKGEHPYYCNNCKARFTESEVTVPPTNGDRIRAMTDDELADFLSKSRGGCRALTTESYVCDYYYDDNLNTDCHKCWLDWLNQEVEK